MYKAQVILGQQGHCLSVSHDSDMILNYCLFMGSFFLLGPQEFEIELEGSQTLRILCYEKCYNKMKIAKEDGESADRLMGKGQVQVRLPHHPF